MASSSGPRPPRISSKIVAAAAPITKRAVSGGSSRACGESSAAGVEEADEPVGGRAVAEAGRLAERGDLDDRHPGDVGLGREELEQRPQRRRHPVRPGPPLGAVPGRRDVGDEEVEPGVVGLQEAVFLVGEETLEGRRRDTGPADHRVDRRRLVAVGRGDPHHRFHDADPVMPIRLGHHRFSLVSSSTHLVSRLT